MSNFIKTKSILLLFACLAYVSQANAVLPSGCYKLDSGKASVSVNVPSILTLSASVPALSLLSITNSFSDDGSFSMSIPLLGSLGAQLQTDYNGTWLAGKSPNFTANLTDLNSLAEQLQSFGIVAQVKQSYSGKVTDRVGEKISGAFTISLTATLQGKAASAKISGTFNGTRSSLSPCSSTDSNAA